MTNEDLAAAVEALDSALEAADDAEVEDRLDEQRAAIADLADADPDHGRLARHEHHLRSIADDAGGDVADHVQTALDRIHDYRGTVEGV